MTSLIDQAGSGSYTYDPLGRMAAESRTISGITKSLSYQYNVDGSLKQLTYPSGHIITYTFAQTSTISAGRIGMVQDTAGNVNFVTGASGTTSFVSYTPDGLMAAFSNGYAPGFAGITNSFSYNKRLQPVNMTATSPSGTVFSIGYDFHVGNGTTGSDNGNVWGITNYKDSNRSQAFSYDALNRLTSAQNSGTNCAVMTVNGKTEYWGNSYGYDAWGNVLGKTITKCGAENLSLTADAHNWIHGPGTDYQYDAAGNMTYDATANLSYTFDQENRISGANGYAYVYDADGNRVEKITPPPPATPTGGTLYWYMTPGIVGESDLLGTMKSEYVFFNGERVARRDGATGTGGVFYYFSDHLKTASIITDSAGTIKADSDYYPWGGELQFVANDSNDYKFTGKERDGESGLDNMGARYYSSGLGRFVTADWSAKPVPIPYADLTNPQSFNQYAYVLNNPSTKLDPDGHADEDKKIAADAQKQAGSMHWAIKDWNVSNGQLFRSGSDKCNEFVSDVTADVGGEGNRALVVGTAKIPTASQYADPKVEIRGLSEPRPLSEAKPGDVIAQQHGTGANGNAEGHAGIVVTAPTANSPGQTASANANQGGKVTVNDWGFRNPNANPNNGERNGANSPPPVVRHPLPTQPQPTPTLPL